MCMDLKLLFCSQIICPLVVLSCMPIGVNSVAGRIYDTYGFSPL